MPSPCDIGDAVGNGHVIENQMHIDTNVQNTNEAHSTLVSEETVVETSESVMEADMNGVTTFSVEESALPNPDFVVVKNTDECTSDITSPGDEDVTVVTIFPHFLK